MKQILHLIVLLLVRLIHTANIASRSNALRFYEEPTTTYLTKNSPATLRCKIENARTGFFKCNNQWSQDPVNSKIIQIGNKQVLFIEQAITKSQLDEFKKQDATGEFWCVCQGWLNSADDTLISPKAFVKLAHLDHRFEWEPFPTSGLIGKSVEIRCLPPEGEPKPNVYWLKNNQPIEKSNKRILISNEGSLLINEVRQSDAANYTCIAENLAGKRLSDPAELTVSENKGWSEWSNWTECLVNSKECGEGIKKRTRECLNPPTINNAIGCDGFPQQTITCYIPCSNSNNNNNNIVKLSKNSNVGLLASLSSPVSWSQWSSWSMTCNSDCMRTRQRDCKINSEKRSEKKCSGPDTDYSNCTFYCEPLKNYLTTVSIQIKNYMVYKQYIISTLIAGVSICVLLFISVIIIRKCLMKKPVDEKKECLPPVEIDTADHYPIYYSVQPDYSPDQYMELTSPLVHDTMRNINEHTGFLTMMNKTECGASSCSSSSSGGSTDERCNAARNCSSSTTTSSGSNSTTSSKIILNSSPTDTLVKSYNAFSKHVISPTTVFQTRGTIDEYEDNAFQIMKLIQERKQHICPSMAKNIKNILNESYELYSFNIAKSGGVIEIPKFASYIMIPDDTISNCINIGIFKLANQDLINLKHDQTLLSSFFVVQTDNSRSTFTKPIIISFDHAAQFTDTEWQTSIVYKAPNSNQFEEINEDLDENFYSHIVSNKCYIMTEKDGIYALVGRPKASDSVNATKQMKYAILLVNGTVKVYIMSNTKASIEIFNEEIQKSNARVVKMPEVFEVNVSRQTNLENAYLSLDVNIVYRNKLISYDSISRKMRLLEIWNSTKDFIEIDVPCTINSQSINGFDLSVEFKLDDILVFSYSSSNSNAANLHTANCNQQEFYSSVSVSPLFLPLNITSLLDEYVLRCFKMNTLKKNDWKLFANLLKCDKQVVYFSNKENSFELIMSLWLMINLNRSTETNSQ